MKKLFYLFTLAAGTACQHQAPPVAKAAVEHSVVPALVKKAKLNPVAMASADSLTPEMRATLRRVNLSKLFMAPESQSEGFHDEKTDKGTHEHAKKKTKKPLLGKDGKPLKGEDGKPLFEVVEVADRVKYSVPSADFKDQQYWGSGNFYYETGVKTASGISATITAGKSIFWKITATRLTPAEPK